MQINSSIVSMGRFISSALLNVGYQDQLLSVMRNVAIVEVICYFFLYLSFPGIYLAVLQIAFACVKLVEVVLEI